MSTYRFNKQVGITHSVIWISFWAIDFLFVYAMRWKQGVAIVPYFFTALTSVIYFYTCTFFIILPRYKNNKVVSLFSIMILVLVFAFGKFIVEKTLHTDYFDTLVVKNKQVVSYLSLELWRFTTMTFYAFAYWYYLKSIQEEKQRRHTEEKLLKAEIDFLKAQINPHFVFNTLNFVYNDVTKTNPTSGDAILSLTKLMRYSVESTKSEHSTVAKELEAIGEYIHLQKIRFGESLALNYTQSGSLLFFSLPPLVLLSLIENAFKYGIHDDYSDPIVIDIKVSSQGLGFLCRNKKRMDFQDKETTAVGNKNIKRRLEMAYPDNFVFRTQDSQTHFEVLLDIKWRVT
jgi:two-component system LytT family sensor kinase